MLHEIDFNDIRKYVIVMLLITALA